MSAKTEPGPHLTEVVSLNGRGKPLGEVDPTGLEEARDRANVLEARLLYSLTEAGKLLGCNKEIIYQLVHDGDLRIVDIGTRGRPKWRVRRDDLLSWIDDHTQERESGNLA
ncbi:helix-turn-helix domain-containing protein [Zhihengliuella flava]|uniref:Excisionase family DNA binding protein n=1 Tax=Zhihengliuella flava TaxID=1285193 RepID=A0A931D2N8_9MICC|nr:helix-turn-helix domain-containing protein [Zhihengliuella flava]MBG6083279.1 excisionase family DNA binding protein [Zhihengliuella flava]